jgi:Transmembrane secretion effector
VVFVLGVARSFSNPAGQALVMSLVPDEEYPSAAAWNNSMNQTTNIVGPAIGGLLFPFGIYAPFIAAGAAFVVAFALVARIAYRPQKAGKPPVTLAMLAAGYKFIWRSPIILGAITLDLVAVLLAGATALLPIFARDIFETGPWGLGLLRAMPSVGSVAAALMLAYFPLQAGIGKKMLVSVAIYGFATIGFGLSTHILMAIPFLIIIGAADMVSVVIRQTLIQVETPPEMRGRVVAVHTILTGTSNQLGEFESGALAWAAQARSRPPRYGRASSPTCAGARPISGGESDAITRSARRAPSPPRRPEPGEPRANDSPPHRRSARGSTPPRPCRSRSSARDAPVHGRVRASRARATPWTRHCDTRRRLPRRLVRWRAAAPGAAPRAIVAP